MKATKALLKCKFWSLSLVKIVKPKLFHSQPNIFQPRNLKTRPESWV